MRAPLFALVAIAAGVALTACGSDSNEAATTGPAGGGETIAIGEVEYSLDPASVKVDEAGTVTFRATNNGTIEHALEVEGQGIEEELDEVSPGSSNQLTVTFSKAGTYEFYCPVDGHRAKGMEGELTIGAASAGGAGTTEDNGDTGTDTGKSGGGYGY